MSSNFHYISSSLFRRFWWWVLSAFFHLLDSIARWVKFIIDKTLIFCSLFKCNCRRGITRLHEKTVQVVDLGMHVATYSRRICENLLLPKFAKAASFCILQVNLPTFWTLWTNMHTKPVRISSESIKVQEKWRVFRVRACFKVLVEIKLRPFIQISRASPHPT